MRFINKMAVASAAAGLAVAGTVAAGGGVANAATNQNAVSCSVNAVVLEAGVLSSCSTGDTTVDDPTSFTLTTSEPGLTGTLVTTLTSLLNGLGLSDVSTLVNQLTDLTESVSFNLACDVNGNTVTVPESYSTLGDGFSHTFNLQSTVGSPVPNDCTVQDFTVKSLVSLSALDIALINGLPSSVLQTAGGLLGPLSGLLQLLGLPSFTGLSGGSLTDLLGLSVSASLTANTAVPGAIWTGAGTLKTGLDADICADDAGNGDANAEVQVYQCTSDLAQFWVQASTGQLVRNGDCMAQDGSKVKLEDCGSNPSQVWDVKGTGGSFNTIVNQATGECLTWPKALDFTQLTVTGCTGKAGQLWTAPNKSAA
jgi:hypothetical protein